MEKTITKYVVQRADGQFYYKRNASSSWGFTDDFEKAHLFETERGAKQRASLPAAGKDAKIRKVAITLVPEDDTVYIPSVWTNNIKSYPSTASYARYDGESGKYEFGTSYYDAEGNEITEAEYKALLDQTRD